MIAQKSILESIIIRFTAAGLVQGIAALDKAGFVDDATGAWIGGTTAQPAREIALSDLTAAVIDPTLAGQQATITDLNAQLGKAKDDAAQGKSDLDAATAQIQKLKDQLVAQQPAPVSGSADVLLEQLNGIFVTIPDEYKAQFASEYATVRVLIQAGQPALAAAVVQGVAVPDALAALKAQITAVLTSTPAAPTAPAPALAPAPA